MTYITHHMCRAGCESGVLYVTIPSDRFFAVRPGTVESNRIKLNQTEDDV